MIITGIQKVSLIDYPEHIACVIFTRGCNLRCPYCHNPELVDPERYPEENIPVSGLWQFLENRKTFLDRVCITGGEPTLQEDIEDFTAKIRSMGFKIKLDTNGSKPDVLKKLLKKNLLDYVAMDIKVPLARYKSVMGFKEDPSCIGESIDILENSYTVHEFRTTVVPGIHACEDMDIMGDLVKGTDLFFIQNFRPSKHLQPGMEGLRGFPKAMLERFRDILEKYINNVYIRN